MTWSRVGGSSANKTASLMLTASPSIKRSYRISSSKLEPSAKAENRLAYIETERSSLVPLHDSRVEGETAKKNVYIYIYVVVGVWLLS